MSDSSSPLLERLARLRERVADLVEHRSATDPTADDPMRGMYLTDDAVRHLLFGGAQDAAPAPGPDTAPSPARTRRTPRTPRRNRPARRSRTRRRSRPTTTASTGSPTGCA